MILSTQQSQKTRDVPTPQLLSLCLCLSLSLSLFSLNTNFILSTHSNQPLLHILRDSFRSAESAGTPGDWLR